MSIADLSQVREKAASIKTPQEAQDWYREVVRNMSHKEIAAIQDDPYDNPHDSIKAAVAKIAWRRCAEISTGVVYGATPQDMMHIRV